MERQMKTENSYKWFRSLCFSALQMKEKDVRKLLRDLDKGIIKAKYFGGSKLEVNL